MGIISWDCVPILLKPPAAKNELMSVWIFTVTFVKVCRHSFSYEIMKHTGTRNHCVKVIRFETQRPVEYSKSKKKKKT